eukprot:GFKZ01008424.1.p2 GENE.GFKZ01008424.1~~GFKZ01008424.1.p2  ORF type:complete len:195 (-),score=43.69 GFKZ01008424.1:1055-1639(-)
MDTQTLRHLEEANALFKSSYKQTTELLAAIADQSSGVQASRTTQIQQLKKDLAEWTTRVQQARQKSADIEKLLERRSYAKQLDVEREDLIKEILAGTEHTDNLRSTKEQMEKALDSLENLSRMLRKRKEEELPSYIYLRKIFRHLSGMKIVKSNDDVLEGFVSKKENQEVLPFRYDRTQDPMHRVNDLWEKILQ